MNILKKIVAVGTILGMVAGTSPVFAVTAEELLAQIQQLQAQLNELLAQYQQLTGQTAGVPSACVGITFTRDLYQGMSGDDVKCLQALLEVSPQTGYFGPLTYEAVVKFQEKYASEILAPLGLTAGTGYVGPKTRAKLNELLAPVTPPTPPTPPVTPPTTPTPTPTPGVEGTLTVTDYSLPPSGVQVYAGQQNVAVMAFLVKAAGSDIKLERVDLSFSAKPHRCLSYVSLYDGDNPIKGIALTSDVVTEFASNDYRVRFTGLDLVVPQGTTGKVITVKVSAVPVFPTGCSSLTVKVPERGVRGVDGAGLQQQAPSPALTGKTFNFAGAITATLKSGVAADTPKSGVAIISANDNTEVELARFTVKAESLDVTLKEVYLDADENGSTSITTTRLLSLNLYDDTTLIGAATPDSDGYASFTDLKVAISKDTTKTLVVKGLFAPSAATHNYQVKIRGGSGYGVRGEDANENIVFDDAERQGNTLYLYTKAPLIVLDSTQAVARDDDGTGGAETGEFTITFKVTAKGGDIWIAKTIEYSTTTAQYEKVTAIVDKGGTNTTANSAILTSTATEGSWGYKVSENTTETFTVKVTFTNSSSAGYVRGKIIGIGWNTADNGTGDVLWSDSWAVGTLLTNYVYLAAN